MKLYHIFNQKCCLGFFNLIFMLCGIVTLATGFYLFTDKKRILLSSTLILTPNENNPFKDLQNPLFFYAAFILTIFGMAIISISFLGYWTSCITNYCLLTIYFILVLMLLLVEFTICVIITIWPQCLGLSLNVSEMVKRLQSHFGTPGHEQYTVAMDYAQTFLDCCAINDSINYDTSLWRLQKFGKKELTVPLTCCELMNKFEENSHLDPIPINITLCQSVELQDYEKSRHLDGCLNKIESWYREHYIILLYAGLLLALVEFFVLLSIVLNCTKIKQNSLKQKISPIIMFPDEACNSRNGSLQRHIAQRTENIYQEEYISVTPEIREIFIQPADLYRHKYPPTKFKGNNYQLSNNSYLV